MEFDEFFNHAFIRRPQHPDARTPFARQPTPPKSPPAAARAAPVASTVPRPVLSTVPSRPAAAHLEEADDFVLVPSPNQTTPAAPGRRPEEDGEIVASQPIPVPSQRDAYLKVCSLGLDCSTRGVVVMALFSVRSCRRRWAGATRRPGAVRRAVGRVRPGRACRARGPSASRARRRTTRRTRGAARPRKRPPSAISTPFLRLP